MVQRLASRPTAARRGGSYNSETLDLGGEYNLFAVAADGTGLVQLTNGDALNAHPHWGADGAIYFASNQAGNFDVWRLNPPANLGRP